MAKKPCTARVFPSTRDEAAGKTLVSQGEMLDLVVENLFDYGLLPQTPGGGGEQIRTRRSGGFVHWSREEASGIGSHCGDRRRYRRSEVRAESQHLRVRNVHTDLACGSHRPEPTDRCAGEDRRVQGSAVRTRAGLQARAQREGRHEEGGRASQEGRSQEGGSGEGGKEGRRQEGRQGHQEALGKGGIDESVEEGGPCCQEDGGQEDDRQEGNHGAKDDG